MKKYRTELLSPAGNFEKLKAALLYGADAAYLAYNRFGMRSAADNFTLEELFAAAQYAHERGKKIYLTLNTMPHGDEYGWVDDILMANTWSKWLTFLHTKTELDDGLECTIIDYEDPTYDFLYY